MIAAGGYGWMMVNITLREGEWGYKMADGNGSLIKVNSGVLLCNDQASFAPMNQFEPL